MEFRADLRTGDRGRRNRSTALWGARLQLADRPDIRGANIHFQDTLDGERLVFDYRIRPGVVTRRNALDLMRMIGIEIQVGNSPG